MVTLNGKVSKEEYNDAVDEFIKAVGLRATAEHFDAVVKQCVHDVIQYDARSVVGEIARALEEKLVAEFPKVEQITVAALDRLADKALAQVIKGADFGRFTDSIVARLALIIVPHVMGQLGGEIDALRQALREKGLKEVDALSGRELENRLSDVLKKELLACVDKVHKLEDRLVAVTARAQRRLDALEQKAGIPNQWQDSLNNYDVR